MKIYKSFEEFTEAFSTAEDCYRHLANLKWSQGFRCIRCGSIESLKGRTCHHKRCKNCGYDESCTAHTLFHKIKFPIVKAFWIAYQLGTMKKGMSTREISRQHHIHQETAWFFKRKVQQAMHHLQETKPSPHPVTKEIQVNRILSRNDISSIILEIQKLRKGSNVDLKWLARAKSVTNDWPVLNSARTFVSNTTNQTTMQQWKDNAPHQINLRNWLRGIHHRVSPGHLQFYFGEYYYRLKRRKMIKTSVPKLFEVMIVLPWIPYRTVICGLKRSSG